jgi:hypothetical protein
VEASSFFLDDDRLFPIYRELMVTNSCPKLALGRMSHIKTLKRGGFMNALALNSSSLTHENCPLDVVGTQLDFLAKKVIPQLQQFGLDPRDWEVMSRRAQVVLLRHRYDHWFQFKAYISPQGRIRQLHLLDF